MRLVVFLLAALLSLPAAAQAPRRPPPDPAPPVITPEEWWSVREPVPEARQDPMWGRRWNRRDRDPQRGFNNPVDPSLYRLWGLQPLQGLVIRRGEAVFETWYRPTNSTRQAVVRVVLRGDGRTFLQARAGRGCCSPQITRRIDIDRELPSALRETFRRLKDDALWRQPRHVVVTEGGDVVSSVCVNGASYDVLLVDDRRAVHLRRSCDPVEIGSVATAIKAVVGAALGQDARFDDVFAREDFNDYASQYAQLVAGGGSVAADDSTKDAAAEAPAEPAEDPVQEILAADRAFAARSAQLTAAAAFREFMDTDGLLLRHNGEPLRGPDAIYEYFGGAAPETGKLSWEPVEAWASAAGDFGASWGRSRFTPTDPSKPPIAYRYITVWRRNESGEWRGLMDMGVPANDLVPPAPAPPAPAAKPRR